MVLQKWKQIIPTARGIIHIEIVPELGQYLPLLSFCRSSLKTKPKYSFQETNCLRAFHLYLILSVPMDPSLLIVCQITFYLNSNKWYISTSTTFESKWKSIDKEEGFKTNIIISWTNSETICSLLKFRISCPPSVEKLLNDHVEGLITEEKYAYMKHARVLCS